MKALDLAKYIINRSLDKKKPISNLHLQKVLYFTNMDFIRQIGEKLISDEKFIAWKYGPVIKNVYNYFSPYGAMLLLKTEKFNEDIINKEIKNIIDVSIDDLIKEHPWELVKRSHKKNGAWHKAYDYSGVNTLIDDDDIAMEAKGT